MAFIQIMKYVKTIELFEKFILNFFNKIRIQVIEN